MPASDSEAALATTHTSEDTSVATESTTGNRAVVPDHTLPEGSKFGRYSIVRHLGSGGMGAVYEATHTDLKKRVAIKILHPTYAHNDEIQTRFLREGEAASRVRHGNVVDMTDFGVHEGTPFLVMEFLEGESLAARLKREGSLSPIDLVDCMLGVCAAVAAAHDESVIHRDLKPENVFLARTRQGEMVPKVVDFGVCKLSDPGLATSLTATNSLVGSPAYMSPEQIRSNKNVTPSIDQYALGVVMYECLTGRKPFIAETLFEIMGLIVQGQCPPVRELRPEVAPELEAVVLRAMHKDAEARFPSVRELGAALLPFASPKARMMFAATFGVSIEAEARLSTAPRPSIMPVADSAPTPAPTATSATPQPPAPTATNVPSSPGLAIASTTIPTPPARNNAVIIAAAAALVTVGALAALLLSR